MGMPIVFEVLSVFTYRVPTKQVVRTCFCDCFDNMYHACDADQSKDNFLLLLWFQLFVGQVLRVRKRIRTCVLR